MDKRDYLDMDDDSSMSPEGWQRPQWVVPQHLLHDQPRYSGFQPPPPRRYFTGTPSTDLSMLARYILAALNFWFLAPGSWLLTS